jgi:hypothetical protein
MIIAISSSELLQNRGLNLTSKPKKINYEPSMSYAKRKHV